MPMFYLYGKACESYYGRSWLRLGSNISLLPVQDIDHLLDSCAVVSSSPRLLKHKYGDDIDAHDLVIRFNDAPTAGFESHVGNKTDVLILNAQLPNHRKGGNIENVPLGTSKDVIKILRAFHASLEEGLSNDPFNGFEYYFEHRKAFKDDPYYMINSAFMVFAKDLLHGKTSPSTGFLGVLVALQLCREVDVYEITPSNVPEVGMPHYYPNLAMEQYCPHDCQTERQFLSEYSSVPTAETGIARLSAVRNSTLHYCRDPR